MIVRLAIVVAFIVAVDLVARAKLLGPTLSVPPGAMLAELWQLFSSGDIYPHLLRTTAEIFISFAIAVVFGVPSGALLWRNPVVSDVIEPVMLGYYAVPLFTLYPLFLVLFGAGLWPIVAIGALTAYGAIAINTLVALREIPRVYVAVGRTNSVSRWQMVRYIIVPATVPQVFVGLKLGFIYALIGCIAAEFILATAGLGYEIKFFYDNFESREMFAVMLLVIVLSVGTNYALSAIEERLSAHRRIAR